MKQKSIQRPQPKTDDHETLGGKTPKGKNAHGHVNKQHRNRCCSVEGNASHITRDIMRRG